MANCRQIFIPDRQFLPTQFFGILLLGFCIIIKNSAYTPPACTSSSSPQGDPVDCHSFTQCVKGVLVSSRCATGYVFNPNSSSCILTPSIPCALTQFGLPRVGRPCTVQGEIIPSEITCQKFLICRSGFYYPMNCPSGTIFSNQNYKCVIPPDPCAKPEPELKNLAIKSRNSPYIGLCDGKVNQSVPEPFSCSMYVNCEEDRSDTSKGMIGIVMNFIECKKGTLFSAELNICTDPSQVFCDSRYRIVTLYGKDVPQGPGMGRSISGAPTLSRQPASPKFGSPPGKYRAITFYKPPAATTLLARSIVMERPIFIPDTPIKVFVSKTKEGSVILSTIQNKVNEIVEDSLDKLHHVNETQTPNSNSKLFGRSLDAAIAPQINKSVSPPTKLPKDRFTYDDAELSSSERLDRLEKLKSQRPKPPPSILEEYHATVLSSRFNSTAEDQIFYPEDYYVEQSGEDADNSTASPGKKTETSMELRLEESELV